MMLGRIFFSGCLLFTTTCTTVSVYASSGGEKPTKNQQKTRSEELQTTRLQSLPINQATKITLPKTYNIPSLKPT